ncbi:MAG: DUF4173 domain-containing protein [Flavobacteriales bacterium]
MQTTTSAIRLNNQSRSIFILLLIISTYFFYEEGYGINTLAATFIYLIAGHILFRQQWLNLSSLILQLLWLLLAFQIAYSGHIESVVIWYITGFSLAVVSQVKHASPLFSQIQFVYSLTLKPMLRFIRPLIGVLDVDNKKPKDAEESPKTKDPKWIGTFIIALILLIFILLYRGANPIFDKTINLINLDFLKPPLFGFILIVAMILYTWVDLLPLKPLSKWQNSIHKESQNVSYLWSFLTVGTEFFTAKWLFLMLNIIVLVVNLGDVLFLIKGKILPGGLTYAEYVHDGVGALIFSICLAVLLIIYFFRKTERIIPKTLVILVVVFLFQNLMMLIFTAYRNTLYIEEFSITYKRLGVYLYLLMALSGILFTIYKLLNDKGLPWLVNKVDWAIFIPLAIFFIINWTPVITHYNITKSKGSLKNVDWYYLIAIGPTNTLKLSSYQSYFDEYSLYIFNLKTKNLQDGLEDKTWKSKTLYECKYDEKIRNVSVAYQGKKYYQF